MFLAGYAHEVPNRHIKHVAVFVVYVISRRDLTIMFPP
jgi:hypothetical protein